MTLRRLGKPKSVAELHRALEEHGRILRELAQEATDLLPVELINHCDLLANC